MSTKRIFFLLIVCVALLIGSVGFLVVYGNGILEQETKKLLELKAESNAIELQQQALIRAKRDVEQYSELESVTQAIVPQDKDQARAVREIVALAEQSGVKIKSITFPMSNLGSSSSSSTGGTTPSTSTPTISQAKPVSGIKGVYSLEMSIVPENSVTYYQFLEFLTRLEKNRRTSQVSRIKIDPITVNQRNSLVKFELTINIFLRP